MSPWENFFKKYVTNPLFYAYYCEGKRSQSKNERREKMTGVSDNCLAEHGAPVLRVDDSEWKLFLEIIRR